MQTAQVALGLLGLSATCNAAGCCARTASTALTVAGLLVGVGGLLLWWTPHKVTYQHISKTDNYLPKACHSRSLLTVLIATEVNWMIAVQDVAILRVRTAYLLIST